MVSNRLIQGIPGRVVAQLENYCRRVVVGHQRHPCVGQADLELIQGVGQEGSYLQDNASSYSTAFFWGGGVHFKCSKLSPNFLKKFQLIFLTQYFARKVISVSESFAGIFSGLQKFLKLKTLAFYNRLTVSKPRSFRAFVCPDKSADVSKRMVMSGHNWAGLTAGPAGVGVVGMIQCGVVVGSVAENKFG